MGKSNAPEPSTYLETILDHLRYGVTALQGADVFFGHGTDNALSEAKLLLGHVLDLDFEQLEWFYPARLTATEKAAFLELITRRIETRQPAAYLTGKAWFANLPFIVDERVLVPRSPIAELIEKQFQPWLQAPVNRILDLCTGSGCIAIACAYAFPDAEIDALDLSADALAVAEQNIELHALEARVIPLLSDLYAAVSGERYDLIVTNPPYVDAEDMAALPPEFHHEPELGLAAGDDGLDLVRTILREAPNHLTEHGILICEVGNSMLALQDTFPAVPFEWIDFERGGDGVFVLSRENLLKHQYEF